MRTDADKARDWVRYFEICPKLSTLKAVERSDGRKVLELVIKDLGLGSVWDVIEKCTGDNW